MQGFYFRNIKATIYCANKNLIKVRNISQPLVSRKEPQSFIHKAHKSL